MCAFCSCLFGPALPDVFIDLPNISETNGDDSKLINAFKSEILEKSSEFYEQFANYQDCHVLVAEAISHPTDETSAAAVAALEPKIDFLVDLYNFVIRMTNHMLGFLKFIIASGITPMADAFDRFPMVFKSILQCFELAIRFDEIKMQLPNLLSDVSYYRRGNRRQDGAVSDFFMTTINASMFFATNNAALTELQKKLADEPNISPYLTILGAISDICTSIQISHKFSDMESNIMCLRGISVSVYLYDVLCPTGAFTAKTPFSVEMAIRKLVEFEPRQDWLINVIRFNSKNLKSPNTIPEIKELLK